MSDIGRKLLKILDKVVKKSKQKGLTVSFKKLQIEDDKIEKVLKAHWNSKKCLSKAKQCIRKILLEIQKIAELQCNINPICR